MRLALFLLLSLPLSAQSLDAPEPHRFLDKTNILLLSSSAAAISTDALSTQECLGHSWCREINPLARPFVRTRGGQAFISSVGLGGEVAAMYIAHKHGWHRLERWIPALTTGIEAYITYHNYSLHAR